MTLRALLRLLAAGALCAPAALASAQTPLAVNAARRDTISVGTGGTVTLVFTVRNGSGDSAVATPTLAVPNGWSPLFGTAPLRVAPHDFDTWLVGVAAPASAPAGLYVVRVALGNGATAVRDSAFVRVDERRSVVIETAEGPAFVASGDAYNTRFLVRNRGNVPEHVHLAIRSSAKSRCDLSTWSVLLEPGASAPVVARMITRTTDRRTIDDVIELASTDSVGREPMAHASAHVLVVPRGGAGTTNATGLPAQMALRAAGPSAGVAPIALWGSGPIAAGSGTTVDFMFRAPVAQQSIFGERDEYHIGIENDRYAAMLGDGSYTFSKLSSSGFPGFGGSFRANGNDLDGGVYLQHDRWTNYGGTEAGAFLGSQTAAVLSGRAVVVGRASGAHIASFTGRAHLGTSSTLEIETAASDSGSVTSSAARAQLSGQFPNFAYDVGFLHAAPTFAGPGRGNDAAHAAIGVDPNGPMMFRLSANTLATKSAPSSLYDLSQHMTSGALEADYSNALALIYEVSARGQSGSTALFATGQQGLRARGLLHAGEFSIRGEAARDEVVYGDGAVRPFESFRVEIGATLRSDRFVSVYTEASQGASMSALSAGGIVAGGSTQLKLTPALSLLADGSVTLPTSFGITRYAQGGLTLSRELPRGILLSLRAHMARYGRGINVPGMNAVYLELRTPLQIPTGPSRTPGRVEGRVVDAATGHGMSNLLVRLGGQSVITDGNGRVSVVGLKPGHYDLSLESADKASPGVLVGDASVDVLGDVYKPVKFAVALAKGGRITATIRTMAFASGAPTAANDSLVDAGGLANAIVAIESGRDTIFQTTDADGHVDFGDVAPGHWTVRVISADLAEFHVMEKDHVEIDLVSGDRNDVRFRVVPKRRTIRIMPTDGAPVIKSDDSDVSHAGHVGGTAQPTPRAHTGTRGTSSSIRS